MRKRIITPVSQKASVSSQAWLDMESAAVVEVTSEDTAYPIVCAAIRRETGLAGGEAGNSDHPAHL